MVSIYHHHVPNLSLNTPNLHALLSKAFKWPWLTIQEQEFKMVKQQMWNTLTYTRSGMMLKPLLCQTPVHMVSAQ